MPGKPSVLERLKKYSISVKDIANQAWCEKQMELYLTHGLKTTYAIEKGQAMHAVMQEKIYVPLQVEALSYADRLYKTAYENYTSLATLGEKGLCRELKIYGSINGYRISGQIDELQLNDNKINIIEDKTVRAQNNGVSARIKSDTIQVYLYKKLLEDITSGSFSFDNFSKSYSLDKMQLSPDFVKGLDSLGIQNDLKNLNGMYQRMFEKFHSLQEINNTLELRYFDRESKNLISHMKITYDKEFTDKWISYSLKYWNGEREAQPVPEEEKWKCNMCQFFKKQCFVWAM